MKAEKIIFKVKPSKLTRAELICGTIEASPIFYKGITVGRIADNNYIQLYCKGNQIIRINLTDCNSHVRLCNYVTENSESLFNSYDLIVK